MSETLDLKAIERKAFRATHQDGLWDIYIGGVVLSMSILAYSTDSDAVPLVRFGLYLLGLGAFWLIFWAGKKFITTPRLGQVKFGPQRRRRKRTLVTILVGIVLLQVILVALTILLWANPEWAARLGITGSDPDIERLLVATIGALFVGPSMVILAYFNDFTRGYYIAFILSLAVFSLIWFGQPVYLVVAALIIMIPGVVLFVRFLRQHPLPPAEVRHA
jgi:uncharacterized membrane protein YidH (DUF202 family)